MNPVRRTRQTSPVGGDLYSYESNLRFEGFLHIAGIDEAGRGPLAGPVCAAAVVFGADVRIEGVNDSKQLRAERRETLFDEICAKAISFGVGWASPVEIDDLNILRATHLAARRALRQLTVLPDCLILDALTLTNIAVPQHSLIKGDSRCFSIAAASILAKVSRDRLMVTAHEAFPHFGFASHMGYPTPPHYAALRQHGPCTLHRRSFLPPEMRAQTSDAPCNSEAANSLLQRLIRLSAKGR